MTMEATDAKLITRRQALAIGGVLFLITCLPLCSARDLPITDLPGHITVAQVWSEFDNPDYRYAEHFEVTADLETTVMYYGFLRAASWVLPVRWANKLYIACSFALLIVGLVVLLRVHGRPYEYAVGGFALAWTYSLGSGFVSFASTTGLLLIGYGLLARLGDSDWWQRRWLVVANIAVAVGLYFTHVFAWLLWAPIALLHGRWRGLALVMIAALPVLGIDESGEAGKEKGKIAVLAIWYFEPKVAYNYLFDFVSSPWLIVLVLLLVSAYVASVLLGQRESIFTDRRPLALLLVLVCMYVAFPFGFRQPVYWTNVDVRLPAILALVGLACLPCRFANHKRLLMACAPLLLISILHPVLIAQRFAEFDDQTEPFYELVDQIPHGAHASVLIKDTYISEGWRRITPKLPSQTRERGAWRHFPNYLTVERGGPMPNPMARMFPVALRTDKQPRAAPTYVLIRSRRPMSEHKGYNKLDERGKWSLWQRIGTSPR